MCPSFIFLVASTVLFEDDPEGVDHPRHGKEAAEEDVDEEVDTTALHHEDRDRGEEEGEYEGNQSGGLTHPGLCGLGFCNKESDTTRYKEHYFKHRIRRPLNLLKCAEKSTITKNYLTSQNAI